LKLLTVSRHWAKLKVLLIFFLSAPVLAQTETSAADKKSLLIVPAVSYFLPGFGQALDGEYTKAALFFGYFGLGIVTASEARHRMDDFEQSPSLGFHHYRDLKDFRQTGQAMSKHASGLSVFDSFNSRVHAYQEAGQYGFLPKDQNLETVLKAPFQFRHLAKWTTWVPFLAAMAASTIEYNESPKPRDFDFRLQDATASSFESYVAGSSEEAFFRGWMMPILYENTQSFWLSNAIQGTAFGYAHGPRPYFQLAAGYYAGWLTDRNHYDLSEVIFVHAWWDFWVLAASYARNRAFTHDMKVDFPLINFSF
jgi:hypothetical protein